MKHFWAEVVKPFGSQALCNLDPSHILGDVMHLNQEAKILDYRIREHVAFICAAFFEGIESHSQYEQRRKRQEKHQQTELAAGDNQACSHSPGKRNWEWDEQEPEMREHERGS